MESYLVITSIQAVTIAPFFNMFFALGEEIGWRGAMYPYLKEKLGVTKGRIVGGLIWGCWHWPVLGPIVFCLCTAIMGIFAGSSL